MPVLRFLGVVEVAIVGACQQEGRNKAGELGAGSQSILTPCAPFLAPCFLHRLPDASTCTLGKIHHGAMNVRRIRDVSKKRAKREGGVWKEGNGWTTLVLPPSTLPLCN